MSTIINIAHVIDSRAWTFESMLRLAVIDHNGKANTMPIKIEDVDVAATVESYATHMQKALQNHGYVVSVSPSGLGTFEFKMDDSKEENSWTMKNLRQALSGKDILFRVKYGPEEVQ